jgi:glycerophosphoryl diester phosphodiesterase
VLKNQRATERVTLASFHADVIRQARKSFDGPTVLAQREVLALVMTPLMILRRTGIAGTTVQIPKRAGPIELANRKFIDKCHELGLRVDFWTVNSPIEAEILLDRGADGMITDDPARLKPIFDARR